MSKMELHVWEGEPAWGLPSMDLESLQMMVSREIALSLGWVCLQEFLQVTIDSICQAEKLQNVAMIYNLIK